MIARRWPGLLLLLLLAAGCATPAPPPPPAPGPLTAIVYVIDRGWHTDIGLPADEITGPLAALEQGFPGVRYLTVGFGERAFLTAREVTVGETLRALLPSRSALLVTALRAPPDAAFGANDVVALHVSADGLARLQAALWQAVQRTPGGAPARLADGPYVGSEFYAAMGTYDAFDTCNTWTATMLAAAGLPVSAGGVMFSGQVMRQVRRVAKQQAVSARLGHG
ncbi:MAG TPA: DUF2459 domain-containing protein [Acetobacteraceae bacterium]|jgi:uncharacterized protein (TIGR02117 family)